MGELVKKISGEGEIKGHKEQWDLPFQMVACMWYRAGERQFMLQMMLGLGTKYWGRKNSVSIFLYKPPAELLQVNLNNDLYN
jgi:hypothetical protein